MTDPPSLRVVVIADTHLRSSDSATRRWIPEAAEKVLVGCDAILHAGDVLDAPTLERLVDVAAGGGARPPLHAVLGNNDIGLATVLPTQLRIDLAGVRIGMVHDSGPRAGRAGRMRRRFPTADVVVFGHSHAPLDEIGLDGQRLFNPGSPTQRRAQPRHSLGQLTVSAGAVLDHRIIDLD